MKRVLASIIALLIIGSAISLAETKEEALRKIVTTADFRELLLHTKWSWRNVTAGVPDRECTFMEDGTFHHPHFVAKFTIKDLHVVELAARGKHATMTFDAGYQSFQAVDFEKHGITGRRLPDSK